MLSLKQLHFSVINSQKYPGKVDEVESLEIALSKVGVPPVISGEQLCTRSVRGAGKMGMRGELERPLGHGNVSTDNRKKGSSAWSEPHSWAE